MPHDQTPHGQTTYSESAHNESAHNESAPIESAMANFACRITSSGIFSYFISTANSASLFVTSTQSSPCNIGTIMLKQT